MKNHGSMFRHALAGTAFAALMALPFAAQAVDTPAPQAAVTAVMDGTIDLGGAPGQSVTAVSEAFVGNPVLAADGAVIGTVEEAATTGEGTVLLVDLDPAMGFGVDGFTVTLAPTEVSDGQVELGWTKGELQAALEAQIDEGATNG